MLAGPSLPAPRILEGASEGELDEPIARQAAQLCRLAGAGLEAIPAWAEIGRERRANAGRPPFSEPKLGGRGDAERTVLTGGVPARSAMIPVLTRGVRAPRRHDRPAGLVRFPAAITPGCSASSHGTRPGHGKCLRALCTPASALPRLL